MNRQVSCQGLDPSNIPEGSRAASQTFEIYHGDGKVNLPREKEECGLALKRKDSLTNFLPTADVERDMQWEKTKIEEGASNFEEKTSNVEFFRDTGLEVKKNLSWADDNLSSLAMSFVQDKG